MIDGFCGWWVMVILACIWTWGSEGLFIHILWQCTLVSLCVGFFLMSFFYPIWVGIRDRTLKDCPESLI